MRETNASELPFKHRNFSDDIETGVFFPPREEHGGNLLTGHAVSGVQEA
jgi:hypothetical protein